MATEDPMRELAGNPTCSWDGCTNGGLVGIGYGAAQGEKPKWYCVDHFDAELAQRRKAVLKAVEEMRSRLPESLTRSSKPGIG